MNRPVGTGSARGPRASRAGHGPWGTALRRFMRHRLAVAGALVVIVFSVAALTAPLLPLEDPSAQDLDAILVSPGLDHLLGTDRLGRDTLSRLIHGARTSLTVGVLAQLIVLAIAIPVGTAAALGTTRRDNLLMRGVDIVYAFPDLLLIILLRAILGGSLGMMLLAIGLASWPSIARLTRGQALSLKEREFVLAARGMGARPLHVVRHHVLPNALGPVIVAVTFMIPKAIFAEVALSYIGIGVTPPTASWGAMVQEGYGVIFAAFEPVLFPVIAIALTMMAFTFVGDGLRDLLDPRTGSRQT